jgi:N-methylhydantoinase B
VPGRVNGCAYGTINALSLAGHRRDGRRWVMFSFFGGGHGGHPEGDGLNHGNAPISTATIPPIEILEAAYPVMFTSWGLRPDSGGPGRHRGGLGAIYEIELLEEQAEVFLFGERGRFAPPGVCGGGPGALNIFTYEQDDGLHHPPMTSKMVGIRIKKGQRLRIESPGGGGYGPPEERDPAAVRRDVALGYETAEHAARLYGKRAGE